MNPTLFTPVSAGALDLSHRIVLAPLTRMRATLPGDVPNALMQEYYTQRASVGGLLITEATTISPTARGYLGAPGLYSDGQVAGWRKIVDAVHAKGSRIVAQLWHVGRTGHADLADGAVPVAPSAGVSFGGVAFTQTGWVPVTPARALAASELPSLIADYRAAALRAKQAGFDGIELHAGNGYLLDQFLQDGTNKRIDAYGGSIENRARAVVRGVGCGADRVGARPCRRACLAQLAVSGDVRQQPDCLVRPCRAWAGTARASRTCM